MNIESEALKRAVEHYKGDLDTLIEDLVKEWMGPYEDASTARDYNTRNALYGRNALRKMTIDRMKQWMKGELI